ncbi:MAG: hypothetical protein IJK64_06535 [Clostridia bacterium]|nr:hypothetical protein [Clostridia bacterium]
MKRIRIAAAVLLMLSVLLLSACQAARPGSGSSTLKVGVGTITGEFHPFYAETPGDRAVVAQTYRSIQRRGADNRLINDCGGISYEYVGDSKVKYTVTIRDDLRFSNGDPVTIQDVIFFYYFIADASYDGVYSDFYRNDIEGLKAYYYNDTGYAAQLAAIADQVKKNYTTDTVEKDDLTAYLVATKLGGLYGGIDAPSPYGGTWREWMEKSGFGQALKAAKEDDAVLKAVAQAEAQTHPKDYNPAEWYRQKLTRAYIERSYAGGAKVTEISGIRKINDYTCTVLFNSRSINAISQLNALLVSEKFYAVNYVKGEAQAVREMTSFGVGTGPYFLSEYEGNRVTMNANEYYTDAKPAFSKLQFVDYQGADIEPVGGVASGKLDVVTVEAAADTVDRLANQPVLYTVNHTPAYTALFLNTRTMDSILRRAVCGVCNLTETLQARYGAYYTTPYRPLSIRFAEYPEDVTEPYYKESAFSAYQMLAGTPRSALTAAYCTERQEDAALLEALAAILKGKGITLSILALPAEGLQQAAQSGVIDLWINAVPDGATCDKYEEYHSSGQRNLTGISDQTLDAETVSLHTGVGSGDRSTVTAELLDHAAELAFECPLYQSQQITIYNTETVASGSIPADASSYDGFAYLLPTLQRV